MFFARRFVTSLMLAVYMLAAIPSLQAASKRRETLVAAPTAQVLTLRAELNGTTAIPGNAEIASGDVTGTYDPVSHVLRFDARFVNLTGPATNAKFYASAAIDRAGWAVVAAPRPDAGLVSGTAWLDDEQEQDFLAGRWYFNVTTQKHPQGEIRGAVRLTRASGKL